MGQAYLGALGRTRMATVHVSDSQGTLVALQVYVGVDAAADPALAAQLRSDALNVMWLDGRELRIAVPVVYHDAAARLLVLVLGDAQRHRELEERIRVLEQLRDDRADVPPYARDFSVVFGAAGLRALLDQRAGRSRAVGYGEPDAGADGDGAYEDAAYEDAAAYDDEPAGDVEAPVIADEPAIDDGPLTEYERVAAEDEMPAIDRAGVDAELDADVAAGRVTELGLDADAVVEIAAALDAEAVSDDGAASPDLDAEIAAADDAEVLPLPDTLPDAAELAGEVARLRAVTIEPTDPGAPGTDPLTTETAELAIEPAGEAADTAAPRAPGWYLDDGTVELVLAVDDALAASLAGALDLRLVLHRMPTAPVIAAVIGAPAALRAPVPGPFAAATLDVAAELDRAVLRALGKRFELTVTMVSAGRALRRCRLTAPLADNVGYLLQAADEHLHGLAELGALDAIAARDRVLAADFDLLGAGHPERSELRADKLAQIGSARQLRRALAIARHFTWPASEDYLVCTRGFPLSRWHQLRRAAVARAVAWGLWMGPELAQIAVSEGFARSRRDLVLRLDRGFEQLRHDPRAFDIDAEATADNAAAIAEQARALGVAIRTTAPDGTGAIASDAAQVASGSIDLTPLPEPTPRTTDELLALLDDGTPGRGGRTRRLAAALALCDLADPRAADAVVAAALKMSRGEAVRVLAGAVRFGAAALPALIAGLANSKTYLRHGCALALALNHSDDAIRAVVALLEREPTELWHEIARAIGQIGTRALVHLVRDIGDPRPGSEERIAWAIAHVAASGGASAVQAMAAADGSVAPIARKALELATRTAGDPGDAEPDAAGTPSERDLSVNHAFSRQFFEALDRGAGAAAGAAAAAAAAAAADAASAPDPASTARES